MTKENKRIAYLLGAFCIAFLTIIVFLSYFRIMKAEEVKNNSYNKRLWVNEDKVIRGTIYDREDNAIAYSEIIDGKQIRSYKYDYLYSHIIGYSSLEYGKSGLEKNYNKYLINSNEASAVDDIINLINPTGVGNNIKLTIDSNLQRKARELMIGKKGALIAMDPKTGEILAMISQPDFNVNSIKNEWQSISEDAESPFVNRATQGLYEPGSTFKLITALELIKQGRTEDEFLCEGEIVIDGYKFKDYDKGGHGKLTLNKALEVSCNTYFAKMATEIGFDNIKSQAQGIYFNQRIPIELDSTVSTFPNEEIGLTDTAASGIGQGRILASPLNMLLLTSSIANDGVIVKPHIVDSVISSQGRVLLENSPSSIGNIGSKEDILILKQMMRNVVKSGTGKAAQIKSIQVSGKTGTAENSSKNTHAWFAGFAPFDDPKIAIVVLIEEAGGTGGGLAAPIARDFIVYSLNNTNFRR